MRSCPVCKKANVADVSRGHGFWEKKVLRWVLLRPFRCSFCRARFYRLSLQDGAPAAAQKTKSASQKFSAFLPAEDNRNFEELVRQIREKEKMIYPEGSDQHQPTKKN